MKLDLIGKIMLGLISLFSGYILSNIASKELAITNSNNNSNKEKTAILVSYGNLVEEFALKYFSGIGLVAYHFSKKGKIEIIDKSKKEDLERVLRDSTYKNLVIYGHGSRGSWVDSDGKSVKYGELNTPPKERVLQLTCGGGNQKSLVEMCAKKRDESFYPAKERNSFENYYYGLNLLLSQKK